MGTTPFFVIEADEYDTAFFDKRSKFVHYRPRTAILNNLEFDHADIFENLNAIQKQFHHLVRTIPGNGLIIKPINDTNLNAVIDMGCWSDINNMGPDSDWQTVPIADDGSHFAISHCNTIQGEICWSHTGRHNMHNALAATLAARHAGVQPALACEVLSRFRGVKRRMELLASINGICVYDDFAHHPTAIASTLEGLRARVGTDTRIQAVIEPCSNTMRMGIHKGRLAAATAAASHVIWYESAGLKWSLSDEIACSPVPANTDADIDHIVSTLANQARSGDHLVVMSNGSFGGLHQKLLTALKQQASA